MVTACSHSNTAAKAKAQTPRTLDRSSVAYLYETIVPAVHVKTFVYSIVKCIVKTQNAVPEQLNAFSAAAVDKNKA